MTRHLVWLLSGGVTMGFASILCLATGCSTHALHEVASLDDLAHCKHVAEVRVMTSRSYGHNPPLAYLNPYRWWVWQDWCKDAQLAVLSVRRGPPLPPELECRKVRVSDGTRPTPSPLLVGVEAVIGFQSVRPSGRIRGDVWVVTGKRDEPANTAAD